MRFLLFFLFLFPLADSLSCFKGLITFNKSSENYDFSDFSNVECPIRHSCGRINKTYENTDLWEFGCIRKCKGRREISCCQEDFCNSDWKDLYREALGPEEISIVNEDEAIDNKNFGTIYVKRLLAEEVDETSNSQRGEFKQLLMDDETDEKTANHTNFFVVLGGIITVAFVLMVAIVVLLILTSD